MANREIVGPNFRLEAMSPFSLIGTVRPVATIFAIVGRSLKHGMMIELSREEEILRLSVI
jgi:hypothetical protein